MTENPTEKALLPCPFCGGRGIAHRVPAGWRVSCTKCDCRPRPGLAPFAEAEAIAAWNTRPPAGDGEAVRLMRAYYAADNARNDCPECENEGPWEHCGPCSERIGDAINAQLLFLAALNAAPTAKADDGWIVGNGNADQWRTWGMGNPAWTSERATAIRYARREDAEMAHAEDEDAWRVVPYAATPNSGAEDGVTEAMALDLDRRRVVTLAKVGLLLSAMAGDGLCMDGHEDTADLYCEVLMALAVEDSDNPDIILEVVRDDPDGAMLSDRLTSANTASKREKALERVLTRIASKKPHPELDDGDPGHRCGHCAYRWKDNEGERHSNSCAYAEAIRSLSHTKEG